MTHKELLNIVTSEEVERHSAMYPEAKNSLG